MICTLFCAIMAMTAFLRKIKAQERVFTMKKIIIAALFALFATNAYAAEPIVDISVNGSYIKSDVSPIIKNGSVLVPVRAAANALGTENIEWENGTVKINGGEIVLTIGSKMAYVGGEEKTLASSAEIREGRTMVPLRFFAESFGAEVAWDAKSYTVEISLDGHKVSDEYIDTSYTSSELEWLAKIVNAEAEGEPLEGKTGVANVILNRVKSDDFPRSIYDVIFDRKYGVQFTPVADGRIYNEAGADSYKAAKTALKGENVVGESLYFCNPKTSTNFWILNNRKFFKRIGNHDFYL